MSNKEKNRKLLPKRRWPNEDRELHASGNREEKTCIPRRRGKRMIGLLLRQDVEPAKEKENHLHREKPLRTKLQTWGGEKVGLSLSQ